MITFKSVQIEGGLFSQDLLEKILLGELPGQNPQDFGIKGKRTLTEEIAGIFNDCHEQWKIFQRKLERQPEAESATTITRDSWMIPFFSSLGYELYYNQRAYEVDGASFHISHRAGINDDAPPIHIVSIKQELGKVSPTGRPRLSPHSLLQEFLNRTDRLWGIVTNGLILRVLRESTYIRKQAYLEFDLRQIFEEKNFSDFVILYRLLHRTRLPKNSSDAKSCLLEQYFQHSLEQGSRVREHLRDGVEECLKILANGFLSHEKNSELRRRLSPGNTDVDRITKSEFYRHLLRLVYRFIFLLTSEERGLISSNPLYLEHYGISRFKKYVDSRNYYTEHEDLWCSLRVLWKVLSDQSLSELLQVSPLNGELFEPILFDSYTISNKALLDALWHLIYYQENSSSTPRKVNYAHLDVEELGSVYESLLEYHPSISYPDYNFDLIYGSERKSTGSYYTPPELVSELINSALVPVIEEKLKNAKTREEKEKALLSIKVCDPASGSGHFLLAAARKLGKELARVRTDEDEPAPERVREAIRDVVSHCIYGVDKNPLAVELCRVALWLEAHCKGKPLTFLDHKIKCGDSLVGILALKVLKEGIPDDAFTPTSGDERNTANQIKRLNREQLRSLQRGQPYLTFEPEQKIFALSELEREIENIPDDSPENIRRKKQLLINCMQNSDRLKLLKACNLWTASFFQPLTTENLSTAITTKTVIDALENRTFPQTIAKAEAIAQENRFFNWVLEFPEVFAQGGFDVVLGNPPFMGGLKISGNFGSKYRNWLEVIYSPFKGTADLCSAFFRRSFHLIRSNGRLGMVATNTISQGDTRESGLAVIIQNGGIITFARRFVKWPGTANVEVNLICIAKNDRNDLKVDFVLDEKNVNYISSRLDIEPEWEPREIIKNSYRCFVGDYIRGTGFILENEEAHTLLKINNQNINCLFPYLTGDDLNSHAEQKPSRWIICFHDWSLEKSMQYPDLFKIIEERVKPEREKLRGPGDRRNRQFWWHFGAYRQGLREAIFNLERVLVRSRVSELHSVVFVPKGYVYGDALVIFAFDDYYHFSVLQSNIHETWIRKQASSLRTDVRYTPTDCFDTFPFPLREYESSNLSELLKDVKFAQVEQIGKEYHEFRRNIMLDRQIGLTQTYNLFHNPDCNDRDIVKLRNLHIEMDRAVLACYDWEDLELNNDFYQNDRGQTRFMPHREAKRELIFRLLELNKNLSRS